MIIIGEEKVLKALQKSDIVEVAKDYNITINFIESHTYYCGPYIFFKESENDDLEDLLYNISDYEEIEKIIYEDYSKEELEDYDGQWYNEIDTLCISKEIELEMLKDTSFKEKMIKVIETNIKSNIEKWLNN